jgi:ribosome-associated protein
MTALESSVDALRLAAQAADRIKAEDILAFDVSATMGITDALLIASASSERQVLAVAEEIEKDLTTKGNKLKPLGREGLDDARWVLLDYGDFVINVMHEDDRQYYELERLWKDSPSIDLQLEPHVSEGLEDSRTY